LKSSDQVEAEAGGLSFFKAAIGSIAAKGSKVRVNVRFSRCAAARNFWLMQHFLRCERMQHKIRIHRLGSHPSFAAF
jgi:hypothetical protein